MDCPVEILRTLAVASSVCSPHHFAAKCVEEYMIKAFYYFDTVVRFTDFELSRLLATLASSVDSNKEIMAAALYVKGYFPIVTNDDRADVEAVWGYRGNGNRIAMRDNDRTAYAEGICSGSCRGSYNQTVSLVRIQISSIDSCANTDHRRTIPLKNGNFIKCVWITLQAFVVADKL